MLTREFPWLRYPPGGWDQSCFCSLHLSLASSLFFSPSYPLLSSFRDSSVLRRFWPGNRLRFSDVVPSIGPAVGCNYDVAWREEYAAASRPVAFTIARCTHRPILAAIFVLYISARKRKLRRSSKIQVRSSRGSLSDHYRFVKRILRMIYLSRFHIGSFSANSTKKA